MCNYVVRKISFPLSHYIIIVFINISRGVLYLRYVGGREEDDANHVPRFLHGQNILRGNNDDNIVEVVDVIIIVYCTNSVFVNVTIKFHSSSMLDALPFTTKCRISYIFLHYIIPVIHSVI